MTVKLQDNLNAQPINNEHKTNRGQQFTYWAIEIVS